MCIRDSHYGIAQQVYVEVEHVIGGPQNDSLVIGKNTASCVYRGGEVCHFHYVAVAVAGV